MKILPLILAMALGGCVALTPTDKSNIHQAQGNAAEWNSRIQATTQPSAELWGAVQGYSKANLDSWTSLDNIAQQKAGN